MQQKRSLNTHGNWVRHRSSLRHLRHVSSVNGSGQTQVFVFSSDLVKAGACLQKIYNVIIREDENGNVKLECPAIGKQQFAAGRFHIDSQRTATKDADRIGGPDVLRIIN